MSSATPYWVNVTSICSECRLIVREHLTFAAKPKIGGRRQETGDRRKEEERRSQKKSFYKYEMLPIVPTGDRLTD